MNTHIDIKGTVEIIMSLIMAGSVVGIFIRSMSGKTTTIGEKKVRSPFGLGARATQFTCICLIIPCITILALENVLKGETVATIIGGLIGYVLSGVGDYSPNKDN